MGKVVSHANRTMSRVEDEIERRLGVVSRMIASDMANAFGQMGPPPSQAGEYPKRVTGELVESITVVRSEMRASIGPTAEHAKYLAASGRKMAKAVYEENREDYERVLRGGE